MQIKRLLDGYDERPRPALGKKQLRIDYHRAEAIPELAKCLVSEPKVLPLMGHNKTDDVFGNEYGRQLPRLTHFVEHPNPMPK